MKYTQRISRIRAVGRVASPMSIVNYVTEGESRRSTHPKPTRRRVYLKQVLFIVTGLFSLCTPIAAQGPQHGVSLYGTELKYPATFQAVEYANPNAPKGGELTLSAQGAFDTLNPFGIKGTPAAGLTPLHPSLLHATLMAHALDESSTAYGYVAESAERSADGYSIVFNLREQATFHDGSPITPEDVVFSFNLLKEKGQPLYKAYYRDVRKVEKTGPRQVKFTFSDIKNRELPLIITEFPILSKADFSKRDITQGSLAIPLGSGPYKIERVDPGQSIIYKRVEKWWGENVPIMRGHYNFDRIRYIYFLDPTVTFEAFKAGTYDLRQETSAKNWVTSYTFPAVKKGEVQRMTVSYKLPQGMRGFVFNVRRPIFHDRKVRKALAIVFDFEWINKHFFYGLYTRLNSYFDNSELASTGLPTKDELTLLEPLKTQIPEEVFNQVFHMPVNNGNGNIRVALIEADRLLKEAGWIVKDQKRVHQTTGKPLTFDILLPEQTLVRISEPYVKTLKSLGIDVSVRVVDTAQYQVRINNFDFDMIYSAFPQSESPGNEQNEFWGSKNADMKGSQNLAGIKNPALDTLIQKLLDATTRQDLITCVHALDRVLSWNYYVIPHWYSNKIYLAFWNKFGRPEKSPSLYGYDPYTWWVDPTLENQLKGRLTPSKSSR